MMRAWLYYRLSRDEDEEMNSLQNQRQILVDYAEQNGYEIITELFIDHLRQNNVRVYSVTEGIDSANENDDLMIGFKQIFNDFYAKDISKKVKAGMRQKQKSKGLVLTLPLGYCLDRNTNEVKN